MERATVFVSLSQRNAMILTRLCRALAISACLLLALVVLQDRSAAEELTGATAAKALIDASRFKEALAVLRPLLENDVVETNTLFLFGVAAVQASRQPGLADGERETLLDDAIAAFRNILIDGPGLVRVRLELARTFFLKGQDALARRHFERVLAGNPPAPVVANVQRFLSQIRARRRWNMHMGVAVAPDTNIGASSNERFIYIFGLPFR
ncbi:MAG: tetratricopeptide repeat protein, partial [Deltaproteobacteria bacterium]|nr:tetratricopeptide repeat protein [Deltaproteobacteria bacterium]